MGRTPPRRVITDAKAWKAMTHPLRKEILRHLAGSPATSTTIAQALGHNTGTTSYHLRVLADAGIIQEDPGQGNGRERWWRIIPADQREPNYDNLGAEEQATLDEWRSAQIPGEIQLFQRLLDEYRLHGQWLKASRASGYYTLGELGALFEEYIALINKYGHTTEDAPPGARHVQLRMFFLPDEPPRPIGPEGVSR